MVVAMYSASRLTLTFGMSLYLFFFFQAEDGIRDWSVTGVQTCALPICQHFFLQERQQAILGQNGWRCLEQKALVGGTAARSEERRVGKECRARGSADDEKKNNGNMDVAVILVA